MTEFEKKMYPGSSIELNFKSVFLYLVPETIKHYVVKREILAKSGPEISTSPAVP